MNRFMNNRIKHENKYNFYELLTMLDQWGILTSHKKPFLNLLGKQGVSMLEKGAMYNLVTIINSCRLLL